MSRLVALLRDGGLDPGPAREAARHELADPRYHHDPGWFARAVGWLVARLGDLVTSDVALRIGPLPLAGVVALAALAVVLGVRAQGGLRRDARLRCAVVDGDGPLDAAGHRALADAAVAADDWTTAVVERFREAVRVLEERGALDPRPGRTAAEVAVEASAPAARDALQAAAQVFADVVYGGRRGDAAAHARVARAAELARGARVEVPKVSATMGAA